MAGATLATLGLSERRQWALGLLETGLMGAVAGLLALPLGWLLAVILAGIRSAREGRRVEVKEILG